MDPSFVAGDYGRDVVLHPLLEHVRRNIVSVVIIREPLCELRVPYEAMAYDEHSVGLSKLHEFVGKLEVVYSFFGMDLFGFHAVLGND